MLDIPDAKQIPDYEEEQESGLYGIRMSGLDHANRDYYRELVQYYYALNRSVEFGFSLTNDSIKAASDVCVEIVTDKLQGAFDFIAADDFPDLPESRFDMFANMRPIAQQIAEQNKPSILIQDLGDKFRVEVPFGKVLPKQTVFCGDTLYIQAKNSFVLDAKITIYADNIPIPIERAGSITCNVIKEPGNFDRIIELHRLYLRKKYT